MQIIFDNDKDAGNRGKHGVSLRAAELFDWSSFVYEVDDRCDYGETRYRGFGLIENRLYQVAFMFRDDAMRVISLRKANDREVRNYATRNSNK